MKIPSISSIRNTLGIIVTAGTITAAAPTRGANTQIQTSPVQDTFQYVETVPPKGTAESAVLAGAPNPVVFVTGEKRNATIVVDLSRNVLFKYDENGEAEMAYRIASGKPKTPTDTGLRVVSHVERYPYSSAPESTKRHQNPNDYGPRAIILNILNPQTGKQSPTGEFIHGNRNPNTLGKYVSKGCIRMDNQVIRELAKQVKRGDLVLITK